MYWKVCECTGKAERLLAGLSEGGGIMGRGMDWACSGCGAKQ